MASDKCPAFQFYVDDWKGSRSVQRMTFAQRGMYLEMLVEQWDNGGEGLPDDPRACAELLGGTAEEWIAAWPVLRRKFLDRRATGRDGDAGIHQPDDFDASRRVINVKLEKQRAALKKFKRGASKGGQTRAATATRTAAGTYEKVEPPAAHQALTSRSPAADQAVSSTSSSSSIPSSTPRRESARGAGNRGGAGAGAFPGDHIEHLACGPVCFTPRMAAKFANRLGYDRMAAWAMKTCAAEQDRLDAGGAPPGYGDDFGYWTAAYDAEFGGGAAPGRGAVAERRVEGAEETQKRIEARKAELARVANAR